MRLAHETIEDLQDPDKVWSLLSRWVKPDNAGQVRHAVYQFRSRIASNWHSGRVMLSNVEDLWGCCFTWIKGRRADSAGRRNAGLLYGF